MLGIARVYEALNEPAKSIAQFKKVLAVDASNVEGIASLAAHHFYSDQPEVV